MAPHSRKTSGTSLAFLPSWLVGSPDFPMGQLYLLVALFLAEMVGSRVTASLLLQTCAFHTLEGALALAVRVMEARLGAEGTYASWKNTFGWSRAPVTGTLVSAVLLSALCVALLAEGLRRLAEPRLTQHPLALMGIGALAIPIHLATEGLPWKAPAKMDVGPCCSRHRLVPMAKQETEDLLGHASSTNSQPWLVKEKEGNTASAAGPWRTLYLGWMVACFGPVVVFLHSLTIHFWWTPCLGHDATCLAPCPKNPCQSWGTSDVLPPLSVDCWLLYLDPGLAMVVAVAFLGLIWPTLRASALVLLQATPEDLDLWLLERHLHATEGVAAVRELRVWQLDGCSRLVATAHVVCLDVAAFEPVIQRVKQVFCEHGVHDVTVEPNLGMGSNKKQREESSLGPPKRQLCPDPVEMLEFETCV
ncbi:proton-coupled zinc antiporter SLC30A1-like [Ahaetulla prasina]|uniref:proton-coupled zinc antiporter SLC30A1-like n=1 Tax=Ahaetulla prasina TaxID=499056 RepID=UPI00264A397A|nr:proton-coupled zinc antiporter SLC30A1-like [Ahaetulla prasina]